MLVTNVLNKFIMSNTTAAADCHDGCVCVCVDFNAVNAVSWGAYRFCLTSRHCVR